MSDSKVCPVLKEFAGYPGFPSTPIVAEKYSWAADSRQREFREVLDELSLGAMWVTESVPNAFIRYAAALQALKSNAYDPAPVEEAPAGGAE